LKDLPTHAEVERPRSRWKRRAVALLIGWALLELAVLPYLGAFLPLSVRARLPTPTYILSQRSKAGVLPHDYCLVLGDSFAEGQGDWLTSALREGGNPPFQATDVLHGLSGRDVINFGSGGANSVSATAFTVEKRFAAMTRMGLGEPSDVLVYFYEGNDLSDNLLQARRRFDLERVGARGLDDAALDRGIAARARAGFWSGIPGTLLLPYALLGAASGSSLGGMDPADRAPIELRTEPASDLPNSFVCAGNHYGFKGLARGPALDLGPEETDLALRMFDRSLAWTQRRFEKARIHVVYLPSPLACYDLGSSLICTQLGGAAQNSVHQASEVGLRSSELRRRVREFADARRIDFIDPTPALQAAARIELIHGPIDGGHFNRRGYTVLGEVLARELEVQRAAKR
jgi:hypothetical protein